MAGSNGAQFAVGTGDYMFSNTSTGVNAQVDLFLQARSNFSGPVYLDMGNHECNGYTASNCPNGNETPNVRGFMSKLAPAGTTMPYYRVDFDTGMERFREAFEATYVRGGRLSLSDYATTNDGVAGTPCTIDATLTDGVRPFTVYGDGTGPIDAFVDALHRTFDIPVHVRDYHEHALHAGEDSAAVSYVELEVGGRNLWGVGVDPNIVTASLAEIVSAVGRAVTLPHAQGEVNVKEDASAPVAV